MNHPCKCIECGKQLHSFEQQCGPYERDSAGQLIATGSMTLVECHTSGCSLYYVTASLKMYMDTVGKFLQPRVLLDAPAMSDATLVWGK